MEQLNSRDKENPFNTSALALKFILTYKSKQKKVNWLLSLIVQGPRLKTSEETPSKRQKKKILKKFITSFSSLFRVYTSPCSDHIWLPEALLSRRGKATKSTETGYYLWHWALSGRHRVKSNRLYQLKPWVDKLNSLGGFDICWEKKPQPIMHKTFFRPRTTCPTVMVQVCTEKKQSIDEFLTAWYLTHCNSRWRVESHPGNSS